MVSNRLSNQSGTGFVLLNSSLAPIHINRCAAQILFHPQKPRSAQSLVEQLAAKIQTLVYSGGADGTISVCPEFLSGNRWYNCRLFDLESPVNGSRGSSLALLLERRPGAPLAVRRVCRQYKLTRRECQALEYLLAGLANKEIAARMQISPNTVKVFLRLAMAKMGVTSRAGMMSKFIASTDAS